MRGPKKNRGREREKLTSVTSHSQPPPERLLLPVAFMTASLGQDSRGEKSSCVEDSVG